MKINGSSVLICKGKAHAKDQQKKRSTKVLHQTLMYLIKQADHNQEGNCAISKINGRASKDEPNKQDGGESSDSP